MSEKATEIMARINAHREEQAYCYAVLNLWAEAHDQGLLADEIKAFGFDSRMLSPREKAQARFLQRLGRGDPYTERLSTGKIRPKVYNYVRLQNGEIRKLDPVLKAVYRQGA